MLYYYGLRRGEAIGLQWLDIDSQAGTLSVKRDMDFETGEIGKPKTKVALRTLPIPAKLYKELDRVRGIGETFVFQQITDSPISRLQAYRNIWEDIRAALYGAGRTIESKGKRSILTAHYYRHKYFV